MDAGGWVVVVLSGRLGLLRLSAEDCEQKLEIETE
jgi:hypothetical protein